MAGAYFDVAPLRRTGETMAALFMIPNRRGAYGYEIAAQIVQKGDYDQQRVVFDAVSHNVLNVNGKTIAELNTVDQGIRIALADISHLPDVLIVRSWSEAQMHRELRGYDRGHVVRWYPPRRVAPAKPSSKRDSVIVWAPDYGSAETAMHTFALQDMHAELVVVSRDGERVGDKARYLAAESPEVAGVLGRALCVFDATLDDPSWTQAFAAAGYSVAAPSTSGAREVADGVAIYDPWSYRSVWAAASEALGRRQSRAREDPPPLDVIRTALRASVPEPPQTRPLVSIVIPSYNRRDDLVRILMKLKEQTYENFEVIVVNDGGESLADVSELDPRIRVLDRDVNVGVSGAVNVGLAEAAGEYVVTLADDDELYPDHLIRLVEALERTGADVAHSNVIIRYETVRDGGPFTTGYNCSIFCLPMERTEVYASSPVAGHALLMRRSAFARIGNFEETFLLADQEMQIRLSEISDFVHVPHVTAEWLVRQGGSQFGARNQKNFPEDMKRIFERHAKPGRPYIAALRSEMFKNVEARPPNFVFPPVISRKPLDVPR